MIFNEENNMTHMDKGKFFEKHPKNTAINEDLRKEVLNQVKDNNISCAAAEKIAKKKEVAISEIGVTIDLLNVNIDKCQLGLFGYDGKKKLVQPADDVSPQLQEIITSRLENGKLSCKSAWEIAADSKIPRLNVCAACEKLKIKVKPCQLGAF
jgi:hypothetical protein